jgi:hypothetical protein
MNKNNSILENKKNRKLSDFRYSIYFSNPEDKIELMDLMKKYMIQNKDFGRFVLYFLKENKEDAYKIIYKTIEKGEITELEENKNKEVE